MSQTLIDTIHIAVATRFLSEQSLPERNRYAFAYTITISNQGTHSAQLLDRQWLITDGNGKEEQVSGPGVVGEQPTIEPGNSHTYTSGCILETPIGTMQGSYGMLCADGRKFRAPIPLFRLTKPNALN
ncbi:Co2+/Mg2+ efflux protein ApaG [Halopseudomonas salegens]|uniref:Protein ApaG n=1 Tax=Halopseudomonas salegens TaxID=1434072 RepID=A0A1H2DX49_9GAMM|nr:Co2+/Mg2+ efflux protein ApaG [Halopseudomonas salegens]SDT87412.1 ApaG protein [Halopseudomonas salegens]